MNLRTAVAPPIVVRAAELADIDAIYELECASFASDRLSRRSLRRFVKSPLRPVLVAMAGEALAGYAALSMPSNSRSARLYSIAVDPRVGRRGVGRALMLACERHALARRRQSMRLEVRYDNAPAIALYESLGYRRFGEYDDYYEDGAAALRFEKQLGQTSTRAP